MYSCLFFASHFLFCIQRDSKRSCFERVAVFFFSANSYTWRRRIKNVVATTIDDDNGIFYQVSGWEIKHVNKWYAYGVGVVMMMTMITSTCSSCYKATLKLFCSCPPNYAKILFPCHKSPLVLIFFSNCLVHIRQSYEIQWSQKTKEIQQIQCNDNNFYIVRIWKRVEKTWRWNKQVKKWRNTLTYYTCVAVNVVGRQIFLFWSNMGMWIILPVLSFSIAIYLWSFIVYEDTIIITLFIWLQRLPTYSRTFYDIAYMIIIVILSWLGMGSIFYLNNITCYACTNKKIFLSKLFSTKSKVCIIISLFFPFGDWSTIYYDPHFLLICMLTILPKCIIILQRRDCHWTFDDVDHRQGQLLLSNHYNSNNHYTFAAPTTFPQIYSKERWFTQNAYIDILSLYVICMLCEYTNEYFISFSAWQCDGQSDATTIWSALCMLHISNLCGLIIWSNV